VAVGFIVCFAALTGRADAAEVEAVPGPGKRFAPPTQPFGPDQVSLSPGAGQESDAPAPTTGVSFLATKGGLGAGSESGFIPPDTTGAIGPSNIVVPLNGRIKIFDRTGATQYTADITDFFSTVLPSGTAFDPRVEYDRATNRWFVVAINGGANNTVMIATSNGPDVAAGESAFTFRGFVHSAALPAGDAGEFADYPTLATDANSILIGTNNFAAGYNSSSLFVIKKSDLVAGVPTPSVAAFRDVGTASPAAGMFTPSVAENDDPTATTSVVVGVDNSSFGLLDFRRVTYPGGVPTLSAQIQLTVPATAFSDDDVPTFGSTTPMDALDDRLYEAMIATDPASGQPRLWTAHNMEMDASGAATNSGSRIGSRWYEIGNPLSGTPTVIQSGTLFDSAATTPDFFWVPSIAANGQGHALIGTSYAGASTNRFAGVALAQRFAGDPAGTLGPVNFAVPGASTYTVTGAGTRNRWGDYSQVSIDPTDNMTFWAFQEYVNATNQWGVRVIEVKAPPPATPSAASPASIAAPGQASVDVDITGTSTNGSGFYDPGATFPKRPSATVSGGVTVNSITVLNPTTVRLNLNTTGAPLGQKTVTITNPDGQQQSGQVLTVADLTPPDTQIDSGPAEGTTIATASATLTYSGLPAADTSAFECKLDAGAFAACPATGTTLTALGEGAHSFQVRAVDAAGNQDASPASRSFTVNTLCPPAQAELAKALAKLKKAKAKLKKAKQSGDEETIAKAKKKVKKAKKRVKAAKAVVEAVC